jgi:hypothetical protein
MCLPMRPLRRLSATRGMDCRVKPGKGTGAGLRHVGWVERSETHQTPLVGFTALNPTLRAAADRKFKVSS